jgi:hypothetical protein
MVQGRKEARMIKGYLEALASRRPGRPVTKESLERKVATLSDRLSTESDVLKALDLYQAKIDAEDALERAQAAMDMTALETGFVKVAAAYSERRKISYAAWRQAGVPAAVLKQAGVTRTRRG